MQKTTIYDCWNNTKSIWKLLILYACYFMGQIECKDLDKLRSDLIVNQLDHSYCKSFYHFHNNEI